MSLKLISYNVWQGKRLERLVPFLKQEQPDILLLQEVSQKGRDFGNRPEESLLEILAQELELNYVYERMFEAKRGDVAWDTGVCIMSPHALTKTLCHYYEHGPSCFPGDNTYVTEHHQEVPRVVLGATLTLEGKEILFFNTHFTLSRNASVTPEQLRAAGRLKKALATFDEFVLAGDMNTPYKSEVYAVLSEGLRDVSLGEISTLHPTIHPVGGQYHVDYVFFRGEMFKHVQSSVPIVDGSDHLPVVVEFEVNYV